MGLLRNTLRTANFIVTLGGSLELEQAKAHYQQSYAAYQLTHDLLSQIKLTIDNRLTQLGQTLAEAKKSLDRAACLLQRARFQTSDLPALSPSLQLSIGLFNQQYSNSLTLGFGGVVGGTMALGAWGLVSLLGSASTGTAIATLSGVAATNATLAWFGGGALAAGGAGMSGGMLVLGGIVAAPLIFFAAKGAYSKAREFQQQQEQLEEEHARLLALQPGIEQQLMQISRYAQEMEQHCLLYGQQIDAALQTLYPHGNFSRVARWLGIGRNPLRERAILSHVGQQTTHFLSFFPCSSEHD